MADNVNHPKHYTSHPSGIECIEISRHLNFNLGNAFKYLFRRNDKNDLLENLQKAEWYLNDEIQNFGVTPPNSDVPSELITRVYNFEPAPYGSIMRWIAEPFPRPAVIRKALTELRNEIDREKRLKAVADA